MKEGNSAASLDLQVRPSNSTRNSAKSSFARLRLSTGLFLIHAVFFAFARFSPRGVRRALIAGLLVAAALAPLPPSALATTGPPSEQLPPNRYHVNAAIAARYPGQYVLRGVAPRSRIRKAEIAIRINSSGYLQGAGQFYGYDTHGLQTSWIALLYNFHTVGHRVMAIDVLTQTGDRLLGKLFLRRGPKGDLFGRITLQRRNYWIKWRKTLSL